MKHSTVRGPPVIDKTREDRQCKLFHTHGWAHVFGVAINLYCAKS